MVIEHNNNNNNNENQLENDQIECAIAEPLPGKVLEAIRYPPTDGYNWKKYGQKDVRGNKFPRNYYKCTYLNCDVKKKVEYLDNGYVAEIIYKGLHDHPQPDPSSDLISFYLEQEMAYTLNKEDDNDDFGKRRLAQYVATAQMSSSSRSVRQQKWVVQVETDYEVLDDGYRWRKYGKKVVKGNSKPRNYFMCTQRGCIAKKHIERSVDDLNCNILVMTYEGIHNHEIPTTKHNMNNNLNFRTTNFSFDHHNQANNLLFETRVDQAPTVENQERFMRFECPKPLSAVRARSTIGVEQCPQPNLGYHEPIDMSYVAIRGPLELNVEHTQELNASSLRTQLPMLANSPQGYDLKVTMAPPQSHRM